MLSVSKACSEMTPLIRGSLLLASLNLSSHFFTLKMRLQFSRASGYFAPTTPTKGRREIDRDRNSQFLFLFDFQINDLYTTRWAAKCPLSLRSISCLPMPSGRLEPA